MHPGAHDFVARMLELQPPQHGVWEIGSRDINGSVRGLVCPATPYVGIDIVPGPGVDVVADGATYTPSFAVDCIICCEVMEHHPYPGIIARNVMRNLTSGGQAIFTFAIHPRKPHSAGGGRLRRGEHYANVDPHDFIRTLLGVRVVRCELHNDCGDAYISVVKA